MKKTKAIRPMKFDSSQTTQPGSDRRTHRLTALQSWFRDKASIAETTWRKQMVAAMALLMGVGLLSGCQGQTRSEPSVNEAAGYFSSLTKYKVSGDGSISTISADKKGSLYVLARRADLKRVEAVQCKVNGKAMQRSSSNMNYPAGNGQNFFPFAQIEIAQGDPHKLSCNQPNGIKLIALLDPHIRNL